MSNADTKIKHKLTRHKLADYGWIYGMIAPTIIGLIVLNIWPMFQTIYLSFTKSSGFGDEKWVGVKNYVRLFSDPEIWTATANTFIYALIVVPIGTALSLLVAVLLNANIKGKTLYRTLYFLPVIAVPSAVAMVWRWLYNTDFGIINYSLSKMGIKGPDWLADPHYILASIILVGIWTCIGYNMVILLAGLQDIPKTYYEAAEIDGANAANKFFHITMPLISPTMFFVIVTSVISSLQVFDFIFMMVPAQNPSIGNVQSLVYLFYKYTFVTYNRGYGSAIVTFLLVITFILTIIELKLQKKWVVYAD